MDPIQPRLIDEGTDHGEVLLSRKSHARTGRPKFREPLEFELFPEALGGRIGPEHVVRKIIAYLSVADLSQVLRQYDHRGGTPYHPVNLLAVALFGMMDGVRSSRGLEEHCQYDARYIFLMGGHTPDDRTFGRFLERIDPIIDSVFDKVTVACEGKKRSARSVLVDGTKVAGNASWWTSYTNSDKAPSDPDARLQNSHSRMMVGYNAQVSLDPKSGLIVAAEVVCDQNDYHVAPVLLETMKAQHGSYPSVFIADAGYDSAATISALENLGIDTVICPKDSHAAAVYEDAEGILRCPVGRAFEFTDTTPKAGVPYDRYKPVGRCTGCPLRSTCNLKNQGLQIRHGEDLGARFRNRDRVHSAAYQGALLERRHVERVFAQFRNDGFARFLRRTRGKVRTEFIIWALSYNLRKYLRLLSSLLRLVSTKFDLFWSLSVRNLATGSS